jgi:hypothetical protein
VNEELSNRIRFLHYFAGVLVSQQDDPLCGRCKAFANSAAALTELFYEVTSACSDHRTHLPAGSMELITETRRLLAMVTPPADAVGQKKAGKCRMPKGVCFVKSSKGILENI